MAPLSGHTSETDARILLVEDDPDDVHIIKRIIGRAPISVDIESCANGREALDYLEKCGAGDKSGLPDLILLDLNMLSGSDPLFDRASAFVAEECIREGLNNF